MSVLKYEEPIGAEVLLMQSATVRFDGNGNLTSYNGGTYTYDAQNRLISISGASTTATFAYDARNRCVARITNGTATYFTYDGWNLIEDRDASDAQSAYYIHGAATDELLSKITPSATLFYHHDGLGSTVALTDSTGNVAERYKYDIYGAPTVKDASGTTLSGTAYGNRFLFTGREFIAEINLYDYRNRMYSTYLGRFLTTDPIGFDGGDVNIYRYVGNDPVNEIDPYGLETRGDREGLNPPSQRGHGADKNRPKPAPTPPPPPPPQDPLHPQDRNSEQPGEITPPKDWLPAPCDREKIEDLQKFIDNAAKAAAAAALAARIYGILAGLSAITAAAAR